MSVDNSLQLSDYGGEELWKKSGIIRGVPAGIQQLLGGFGQDLEELGLEFRAEGLHGVGELVEHGEALHVDEDSVGGTVGGVRSLRVLQD